MRSSRAGPNSSRSGRFWRTPLEIRILHQLGEQGFVDLPARGDAPAAIHPHAATRDSRSERVDQAVARASVERDQIGVAEARVGRNVGRVADTADVLHDASAFGIGEQPEMSERREWSALATKREIHRAEIGDDGNAGCRCDDGGLAELHRRGELSVSGATRRQMKKSVAVRSDECHVGDSDNCVLCYIEGGACELAPEREVECGNRAGSDFFIGGSGQQFLAKARGVT